MNKKLMAVAVAGALAAPAVAFAQASSVQIYGRANLGVDNYEATGATASAGDIKGRTRVYDAGSRIGFRGEEALGGGLKAVFLIEGGVSIDSGNLNGQNGLANPSVGWGSSRLGWVGLAGRLGTVTFGRSNVWYTNGLHEQWQANYGTVAPQLTTGVLGRGMSPGVARQANTVQYITPVMSGINAIVSWSPNAAELAAANNANTDGRVLALTLQGRHGGFMWAWDWTDNRLNTPSPTATTTVTAATCAAGVVKVGCGQASANANKLRAGYFYAPGSQVSLIYLNFAAKNGGASGAASATGIVDANASQLKQNGVGLVWEHTFGNFAVEANWTKMQDISGCTVGAVCNDTNNTAWFLGGRYSLSKRTSVMASYTAYRNAANYNADVASGGMSSSQGALANGADPRVVAVGVLHNF